MFIIHNSKSNMTRPKNQRMTTDILPMIARLDHCRCSEVRKELKLNHVENKLKNKFFFFKVRIAF